MRFDSTQMMAAKRLSVESDFQEFMKALEAYHEILVHQLIEGPPEQVLIAQGRAQAISRVLTVIRAARTWQPYQPT